MLVSLSIVLFGCDRVPGDPSGVSYRQVGICKGYDTAAGPVTARSDEAFAIFKIEAVDNTKSKKSFAGGKRTYRDCAAQVGGDANLVLATVPCRGRDFVGRNRPLVVPY
jgi:hypothetical protein